MVVSVCLSLSKQRHVGCPHAGPRLPLFSPKSLVSLLCAFTRVLAGSRAERTPTVRSAVARRTLLPAVRCRIDQSIRASIRSRPGLGRESSSLARSQHCTKRAEVLPKNPPEPGAAHRQRLCHPPAPRFPKDQPLRDEESRPQRGDATGYRLLDGAGSAGQVRALLLPLSPLSPNPPAGPSHRRAERRRLRRSRGSRSAASAAKPSLSCRVAPPKCLRPPRCTSCRVRIAAALSN